VLNKEKIYEFNRNKTRKKEEKRKREKNYYIYIERNIVCIQWNSSYFSFFCLYSNNKRTIPLYYLVGWFLFRIIIILCIFDRSLLAFSFSLLSTRFVDKQAKNEGWHPIEEKNQTISFLHVRVYIFFFCSSSKSNIQHLLSLLLSFSLYLILFADLHLTT